MFTEEPDLQLASPEYITDHHVVGPRVAKFIGALGKFTAMTENDLVCVEQA